MDKTNVCLKKKGLPAVYDMRALLHATPTTHNFFNSSSNIHLHDEKAVSYDIFKKKSETFTYYSKLFNSNINIKPRNKRYFEIGRISNCSKCIFDCTKCILKLSEIVFFL